VNFFFVSSRLFENDFRAPLIAALRAKGHQVWHVRLGRQNIVTAPDQRRTTFDGLLALPRLVWLIRSSVKVSHSRVVFVDTTGAFLPCRSLVLRAAFRDLWCFDIFDNLLYEFRGFRRLKQRLAIALLARFSAINIVLSLELLRLFPNAYHLENAAHIGRRRGCPPDNYTSLVMLFAIDGRFDFELVKAVAAAAPQLRLYLYGRPATNDATIRNKIDELCASCQNLIYRGEYRFDEVAAVLAPFRIGFAPYTTPHTLTEFINPDKYYLYLASGMEVISTDIPQARRMSDRVHVARSAAEVVVLVDRIASDGTFRMNTKSDYDLSWAQRADRLMEIICSQRAFEFRT
jgi:hypothetical protein